MKLVSQTRSAFMKAAGHPVMQMINENAAKITGAIFVVTDSFLLSMNYLKNGKLGIDLPPSNPDEWLSLSGLTYLVANGVFTAADKYSWAKKPAGALCCLGAGAMAAAAPEAGFGLYLAAAAPMITGLSLMFEDVANRSVERISSYKNIFAKAANVYLKYPVATMGVLQTGSALSALVTGITNPEQQMMIPYALAWIAGNAAFTLTDNNVKSAIRSAANSPKAEPVAP